ncbi:guanine deaminase [Anaeramoeba flamelloides]|uniref:Guanine deaminase n=1 Tax=Anaeramoeba flamelloides TaxID=1746091 RepID=A0AAV7ZDM8_9EUKA|nr:guanine deaminase [Anaeramoeba flamelloides]
MNRNSPHDYTESTEESLLATEDFIKYVKELNNVTNDPATTPKFVPKCDPELLMGLSYLAVKHKFAILLHVAEHVDGVLWGKELEPGCVFNTFSGLGSDISGDYSPSLLQAQRDSILCSKPLAFETQNNEKQTNSQQAFYLATLGGVQALGLEHKIGNFEIGKEFDAILINPNQQIEKSSFDVLYPRFNRRYLSKMVLSWR